MAIAVPCTFYLLRSSGRKINVLVTVFSITITIFNIAAIAMKTSSIIVTMNSLSCPASALPIPLVFEFLKLESGNLFISNFVSFVFPSAFLWVTDAFLVYRTWVIWMGRRRFIILPGLVYAASVVTGVTWIILLLFFHPESAKVIPYVEQAGFSGIIERWVPSLAFSCGIDGICTTMIAGRLIYYQRHHSKNFVEHKEKTYFSIMVIFIESAALSTISKIIQLAITSTAISTNPIFIPLCTIAAHLILLRKALGLDVANIIQNTQARNDLSSLRFQRPRNQESSNGDRVRGNFESMLIQTIGGPYDSATDSQDQSGVILEATVKRSIDLENLDAEGEVKTEI